MYQNGYMIEQLGREYTRERMNEAREARRARLAVMFRRELRRIAG